MEILVVGLIGFVLGWGFCVAYRKVSKRKASDYSNDTTGMSTRPLKHYRYGDD